MQASIKAAYGKVAHTPIAVGMASLTEGRRRLREVLQESFVEVVHASLPVFTPLAIDGKKIEKVAKRRHAVHRVRGQVLGGKLLVAEDVRTCLAVAQAADPDGEAADDPSQVGNLTYATRTYSSFGDSPRSDSSGLVGSSTCETTIDCGMATPLPCKATCPSESRTRTARIGSPRA